MIPVYVFYAPCTGIGSIWPHVGVLRRISSHEILLVHSDCPLKVNISRLRGAQPKLNGGNRLLRSRFFI